MGLCVSCRKSKNRQKDLPSNNKEFAGFLPSKASKICNHIPNTVLNHEAGSSNCLNRHSSASIGQEAMAASFPNINITNPIRSLVSRKRNRYIQDGFNLDLTYITDSIIAMGYPAENIERVYRNDIEDVAKFLDKKHPNHYMIYNLCSERSYDKSKFHNRVRNFPFEDHNPPKIEVVGPFCEDVKNWLDSDPHNVAVVHCKAGKGRTGTMICCYLLHTKICSTAQEALLFYGEKRTQDTKGVTIPSQVRYVKYYEHLVNHHLQYTPVTIYIKEFIFEPVPIFANGQGNISFTTTKTLTPESDSRRAKSEIYKVPVDERSFSIKLNYCFRLTGDVKIEFYNKVIVGKEKLFHFWFNTFFLDCGTSVNGHPYSFNGEECYELVFQRNDLDKLNKKDKQYKMFNENFKLTMIVEKVPRVENVSSYSRISQPITIANSTPSDSSAESTDEAEEDGWDSVGMDSELFDPRGVGYRILSECEIASQLTSSSAENRSEVVMV